MNVLNSSLRTEVKGRLANETFDLVIVGGGITGAGIALEACLAGMKVALVEQKDYASGTSSKSTKLIHGGLRYLKQLAFKLVKEVGKERAVVHRMAPHLVIPESMFLPIYKHGSMSKFTASAAISVYDYLAEVKGKDRKRVLSTKQTLETEPLLSKEGLNGGVLYAEYRTDDARLTMSLIKTACEIGDLTPMNYLSCQGFTYDDSGRLNGVKCKDEKDGSTLKIQTKVCISAAGPWVDQVRKSDSADADEKLILAKGVHLVFEQSKFPVRQSIYFDVPDDDRMMFAIPRGDKVYAGTTDTFHSSRIDAFAITKEEVDYILGAINETFTTLELSEGDVVSSWAGVRPLIGKSGVGSASEISRKDEIFVSDSGLISIAGGKLTGFRKMAQRALNEAFEVVPGFQLGDSTGIRLYGTGDVIRSAEQVETLVKEIAQRVGVKWADYLVKNYGIVALELTRDVSVESISQVWLREIDYLIDHEQACCSSDILNRRTGRLYFYPETLEEVEPMVRGALKDRDLWDERLEASWELEKKLAFTFFETEQEVVP